MQKWVPSACRGIGPSVPTLSALHHVATRTGERIEQRYVHEIYSVKEWAEMLHEAGFPDVQAFGGWDGASPVNPSDWRLIVRAR